MASTFSCSSSSSAFSQANEMENVLKYRHSVCQIAGFRRGTGLLLTSKVVLFATHVLKNFDEVKNASVRFPSKEQMGFVSVLMKPDQEGFYYSCPEPSEEDGEKGFTDQQLDFSLASLDATNENFYQIERKEAVLSRKPPQKGPVYFFHYPIKEKSEKGALIALSDEQKVNMGNIVSLTTYLIYYKAETSEGSSGAPLFNGQGEVVGFHHGISEDEKYKLAVRADIIANHIFNVMPPVERALLFQDDTIAPLKSFYSQMNEIDLLIGGKLPIEAHYTSLAIVTDKEWKEKHGEPTKQDSTKEAVQLEDLFKRKELQKADKKRVLIQGSAGIGKSTLCQRIAYQWAQGELWPQFKAVIWIRFRNLNKDNYSNRSDLYQVITDECSLEQSITQLLKKDVFRNDCLLILDGYDEIPDERLEFKIPKKGNFRVLEAFQKEFPHMIVTTRPQSVSGFQRSLEFEIWGFENRAIDKYIESFFGFKEETTQEEKEERTRGKGTLKGMLQDSFVRSMCHIPINLEILCSLALEGTTFSADQSLGIAQIYDRLIDWLLRRFFKEKTSLNSADISAPCVQERPEVASAMQALEELAWKGLVENRLYFKNTEQDPEITKAFRTHELNITDVSKIGPFRISDKEGQFIHFTFQEFFGAKHLARLFLEGNLEDVRPIVMGKKFDSKYQLVFSMATGLLAQNEDKSALIQFFDILHESPRDLGRSRELILFAKYFEECGSCANKLSQYEELIQVMISLLADPNIFLETKFDLLNRNHFLLANDKIISFFLENLKDPPANFLRLLTRLINQKNHMPEKILSGDVLDKLINLFANSSADEEARESATQALWTIIQLTGGGEAKEAIKRLVALLEDPYADDYAHKAAAKVLWVIPQVREKLPEETLKKLAALLEGSHADKYTGEVAGKLPEETLKRLVPLLGDLHVDKYMREVTGKPFGKIVQVRAGGKFPENTQKVPVDVLANSQADRNVRESAAYALMSTIEKGEKLPDESLKRLIALLEDLHADDYAREAAAKILWMVALSGKKLPEGSLKRLIALLEDLHADDYAREAAAKILWMVVLSGEKLPKKELESLTALLEDLHAYGDAREIAREALKSISHTDIYKHRDVYKSIGDVEEQRQKAVSDFLEYPQYCYLFPVYGAAKNALMAAVEAGGDLPENVLERLIVLFMNLHADKEVHKQAGRALKQAIKENKISQEQMQKISERALFCILAKHSWSPLKDTAAELLKEVAKTEGPHVQNISNRLVYSIKIEESPKELELINELTVKFLKFFQIKTEEDKRSFAHICKINGIAFYEANDHYYIADKSEVYPLQKK